KSCTDTYFAFGKFSTSKTEPFLKSVRSRGGSSCAVMFRLRRAGAVMRLAAKFRLRRPGAAIRSLAVATDATRRPGGAHHAWPNPLRVVQQSRLRLNIEMRETMKTIRILRRARVEDAEGGKNATSLQAVQHQTPT